MGVGREITGVAMINATYSQNTYMHLLNSMVGKEPLVSRSRKIKFGSVKRETGSGAARQ